MIDSVLVRDQSSKDESLRVLLLVLLVEMVKEGWVGGR